MFIEDLRAGIGHFVTKDIERYKKGNGKSYNKFINSHCEMKIS